MFAATKCSHSLCLAASRAIPVALERSGRVARASASTVIDFNLLCEYFCDFPSWPQGSAHAGHRNANWASYWTPYLAVRSQTISCYSGWHLVATSRSIYQSTIYSLPDQTDDHQQKEAHSAIYSDRDVFSWAPSSHQSASLEDSCFGCYYQ